MKNKLKEMYYKFESAIYDNVAGDFDKNRDAIAVGKDDAVKAVLNLHQQAIKNILDRLCHSPKDIPTILKEIAKENDIVL